MRLSEYEKEVIVSCTKDKFGKHSRNILFGSRIYDSRKEGDIDLLILSGIQASPEEVLKKKILLLIEIEKKLFFTLIVRALGRISGMDFARPEQLFKT